MAAKRAKGRGVLSRQEIASRKRMLSEKKLQSGGTGRRALAGLVVLASSALSLVAVATYDSKDRIGPGFINAVGPVGHAIAETLRGVVGLCAYVLPVAGLYAAGIIFVGAKDRRRWPQVVSLILLLVAGAVLFQILLENRPGMTHAPGGLVGHELGQVLRGLFSTVGTLILVSAICAAAFIVGTQYTFLKLCALAWAAMRSGAAWVTARTVALFHAQREALQKKLADREKAKEEEAAFLAQLEAEEAELARAEREVEEAEAMAEEALRLAKAADEARLAKKKAGEEAKAARKKGPAELEPALPAMPAAAVPPPAGADPAWAATLVPPKLAAPGEPPPSAGKREKKTPQLVLPPAPPAEALASQPKLPADPAAPEPVAAAAPATLSVPPSVQAAAPVPARTPLIVEPKAPPKPTRKKEQEQFEFVGDRKSFTLPPLDVLHAEKQQRTSLDKEAFFSTAEKLREKLADFGITGEVVEIRPGPVVTMYEFLPGKGIKVSRIASLADDLAMAMEAMRVRIVAPIPGKNVVGIEVPNKDRETVYLQEIAEQDAFQKSPSKLAMCVGKDIEGMPYVLDLAKAPHLLIAGTTGSGKSVAVNSMIMSLLLKATPEEVRFIMVDPKMLELSVYEGIPHLLLPVVTDPKKAALALRWAVEEMERRYQLLAKAGVRNISGYNKLVQEELDARGKVAAKDAVVDGSAKGGPAKRRKMVIVDVGEGGGEAGSAKPPDAAAELGVAAPKEEPADVRVEVPSAAGPELGPSFGDDDARAEAEQMTPEETAALAAASEAEKAGEEKPQERKKLPYLVVIIDELADLMMVASREVETYIARLAQMARAAGIHLMVATQRPSTDVVTGVIKANFPTRVSFMLRSKPDSMTILGTTGAEALLGMGDMLIMPPNSAHLQRVHGAYVSEGEIQKAVDHLKAQGKPVYDENILKPRDEEVGEAEEDDLSDELYDQALAVVSEMRQVSISMLQRKMRIGYNRAARMIERMERDGVVGPADGAKPREVLLRPVGEMPGAGAA